MKIAALISLHSFEVGDAITPERRKSFPNTMDGVRSFERWVLEVYDRGDDISIELWDAEVRVFESPLIERVRNGNLRFRSWLPWRSANGLLSFNHVNVTTAAEYSRRFGYDQLCLEPVLRRALGEFPFSREIPA